MWQTTNMKKLLLAILTLVSAHGFAASVPVPTKIRTATTLPSACQPGDGIQPGDLIILVSGGQSILENCVSTNVWKVVGPITPAGSTYDTQINAGGGVFGNVPNGITGAVYQSTNGANPSFVPPGVLTGTTNEAAILCDTATATQDRGRIIHFTTTATITVPQATSGTGCPAGHMFKVTIDGTGQTVTFQPTTSTVSGVTGTVSFSAQTSRAYMSGQSATWISDGTNWYAIESGGLDDQRPHDGIPDESLKLLEYCEFKLR